MLTVPIINSRRACPSSAIQALGDALCAAVTGRVPGEESICVWRAGQSHVRVTGDGAPPGEVGEHGSASGRSVQEAARQGRRAIGPPRGA